MTATTTYSFELALYFRGEHLNPNGISEALGISPSKSQIKGERKVTPSGKEFLTKIGLWALITETQSNDLPMLVRELGSKIGANNSKLPDLPGVDEAYVTVFAATDADADGGGTCEFQLSPENVQALHALGLPIRFTVAVVKA